MPLFIARRADGAPLFGGIDPRRVIVFEIDSFAIFPSIPQNTSTRSQGQTGFSPHAAGGMI
jgi:hypothetical protein